MKKQSNHQISNNNSQNNMGMSLDDLYAKTPDNSDGHIVSQCWQKLQWGTIAEKKKCNDDLADGKVIQWLLSVESIEQSNGNEYVVHSNAGLGVPIDIYVTSRSDEDKVFLENLKMSDGIAFKGVLNTGENSNVIIVKPAILVPMPVKPTTQIVEPSQADTTQNNSEPSLTDLKSSESVKNKGHSAFIYNPPSNVRSKPDGDVLCSITKPTDINIYDYAGSTYDGSREVKWYYTDACGSMGVIAYSQFR